MSIRIRYSLLKVFAVSVTICLTFPVMSFSLDTLRVYSINETLSGSINRVSGKQDFNGDGIPDLIFGDPYNDSMATDAGRIYILSGLSEDTLLTMYGDVNKAWFGWSVDFAGDFNGDGHTDIIVGAPGLTASQTLGFGRVFVFSGLNQDTLLYVPGLVDIYNKGWSVAGGGDFNNDGLADVILGAPTGAGFYEGGTMLMYLGDTARVDWFNIWQQDFGTYNSSGMGARVGFAGDVNNDGMDDAIYNDGHGPKIMSGADGTPLLDTVPLWAINQAFDGVGDMNKDGYDDIVVGYQVYDGSHGRVTVFSGATGEILFEFFGEGYADAFGSSVAGCGDMDGDGYPDIAVGANNYRIRRDFPDQAFVGKLYLFSGFDGHLIDTVTGNEQTQLFPSGVKGVGDMNNDGRGDLLVMSIDSTVIASKYIKYHILAYTSCCNRPGDADFGGDVNIGDAVCLIKGIFNDGCNFISPICLDQMDANGSNEVNVADATYIVKYVFQNGLAPICGTTGN